MNKTRFLTVFAAVALVGVVAVVSMSGGAVTSRTTVAAEVGNTGDGTGDGGSMPENPLNLKERLVEIASNEGPKAAIDAFHEAVAKDPYAVTVCHGVYEAIGRAASKTADGLPEFYNTECQFGYVHGVLYSLAGKYKTVDELFDAVKPYCERFVEGDGVNGPNSSCNHGIGHIVATIVDAPSDGLVVCGRLRDDLARGACVDGLLMEYGEDNLVRYAWMQPGHDNTDVETTFDNSTITSLCRAAPAYAVAKCYSRIWMFVAPDTGPGYLSGASTCADAPTRRRTSAAMSGSVSSLPWSTSWRGGFSGLQRHPRRWTTPHG